MLLVVKQQNQCIPHACGGDPNIVRTGGDRIESFPTHVGVIPKSKQKLLNTNSIPHACGGDPYRWRNPI